MERHASARLRAAVYPSFSPGQPSLACFYNRGNQFAPVYIPSTRASAGDGFEISPDPLTHLPLHFLFSVLPLFEVSVLHVLNFSDSHSCDCLRRGYPCADKTIARLVKCCCGLTGCRSPRSSCRRRSVFALFAFAVPFVGNLVRGLGGKFKVFA